MAARRIAQIYPITCQTQKYQICAKYRNTNDAHIHVCIVLLDFTQRIQMSDSQFKAVDFKNVFIVFHF